MTRLLHYSSEPFLGPVKSLPQPPLEHGMSAIGKPHGLWVSVEGVAALDAFHARYARQLKGLTRGFVYKLIDWQAVAAEYQGIIIAPYVWPRRLHDGFNWYYGWDCASGCLWDREAVADVTPVPVEPREEEAA